MKKMITIFFVVMSHSYFSYGITKTYNVPAGYGTPADNIIHITVDEDGISIKKNNISGLPVAFVSEFSPGVQVLKTTPLIRDNSNCLILRNSANKLASRSVRTIYFCDDYIVHTSQDDIEPAWITKYVYNEDSKNTDFVGKGSSFKLDYWPQAKLLLFRAGSFLFDKDISGKGWLNPSTR